MRIALTTALMMAATFVWADEPTPAEAKPTPAAEAQANPDQQAPATDQQTPATSEQSTATEEQPAATEQTASEAAAPAEEPATADTSDDDKPFKVPPGYRAKRVNGKQMYCASNVVLGSRFGKEQCRTEEQLRAIEKRKAEMEQR